MLDTYTIKHFNGVYILEGKGEVDLPRVMLWISGLFYIISCYVKTYLAMFHLKLILYYFMLCHTYLAMLDLCRNNIDFHIQN